MRALYDSSVSATVSGSTARTWMGGETVTPVTLALTAFARAVPYWIASSDKSDPSVGMRMCVCITIFESGLTVQSAIALAVLRSMLHREATASPQRSPETRRWVT